MNHDLVNRTPGTPGPARRRPILLREIALSAIAGMVLVGCVGCSDDDPDTQASVTRTASQPATGAASATTRPDEQRLRSAQADYFRRYAAALARPGDKKAVDALLALYVPDGPGASEIRARMKGLADRGFAGRGGPDGYFVVEDVAVPEAKEGAEASVTVCVFDDAVVFDARHNGPDGKPIVVNDKVESGRTKATWILRDGEWLLDHGDIVDQWPGVNRCPPGG